MKIKVKKWISANGEMIHSPSSLSSQKSGGVAVEDFVSSILGDGEKLNIVGVCSVGAELKVKANDGD